ncbi:MAG: hypothetical protein J7J72_04120 [Bacteroidales bacterium]|nr:hypothetical protein [Bacteroidales bacterium]
MKLNTAFEEMEVVLNELNEQFETIKNNEIRIPQIELDIIMGTMRTLYEHMSYLNKQKHLIGAKDLTINVHEEVKEEVVDVVEEKNSFENETTEIHVETSDELKVDVPYEVTRDFLEEINNSEETAKNGLEELQQDIVPPKQEESKAEKQKPSLLLQFEDEIFSVNENVANKSEDKSLVNKLSNTRIENLKSAIGINDKFFFINELFGGNSQAYEDVIYALNNFKRFEESMQYVSTLKYRHDWNTETEAYQKLIRFLERKFIEVHA